MNLKRRSLLIFSIFMATALLVITIGLSVIDRSEIEKQIGHLVPEFRRSLIGGDNRAIRDLIRSSIKEPLTTIEVQRFDGIVVDSQKSDGKSALLIFNYESPLSLMPSENAIGYLRAQYTLDRSLKNGFFLWLIFLVISFPIFLQFRRNLTRIEELNTENARESAIARTTQMLAHDVRKPFALFRMTIDRVKTAGTPEQVQQALQESLPEVERSLASVNGLISDVLNVGGEFSLVLKPVRLAPIVDDVIDELRKLHPTRTLRVQTNILPDMWVEADDTRLPRVFLNILSNAIEAVTTTDVDLWVNAKGNGGELGNVRKTGSDGKNIEVRVGNKGSYIPPDSCEKLFDLFYTSGKKGGTGLGLAIVSKIIEGHGGHVKCQSERTANTPQGKVEFVFTLRATVQPELAAVEHQAQQPSLTTTVESNTTPSQEQPQLPKVIFLDDSPLARWAWETKLKGKVELLVLDGPKAFWTKVGDSSVSLSEIHTIITDHYFAPDEKVTGLEFASELRVREFKGRILLASNGEFTANELAGIVDKIVDKQPAEWETLKT